LTLPVSSAIGYSLGILFARVEHARPSTALRMRVLVGWVIAFAVACSLMTRVEQRLVYEDRKLRVAVRLAGTPLASYASALCAVGTGGVVLQGVTKLELLEHADCPGGRPMFGIDRVRVVDGPHKALEGWVISSQVWRPLPLP